MAAGLELQPARQGHPQRLGPRPRRSARDRPGGSAEEAEQGTAADPRGTRPHHAREDRRGWQRGGREAVLRARQGHLRVSAASSPALIIHFTPGTTAADRDRLVALLADYDLVAIQEDDLGSPRTWTGHFSGGAARTAAAEA